MSYEYKDEIIMNLKDYNAGRRVVVGGTNAFESKIEELHEVYSQVSEYEQHKVATTILVNTLKSKANEYEAKVKAWDLLKLKLDGKNKSILSNPKASDEDLDFVGNNTAVLWEMSDLEMKFKKEYESGESDE